MITERGTAQAKSTGTTLDSTSFTLPKDDSLQVGVVCENSLGPPASVTINDRPLKRKETQNNALASMNTSLWIKARAAVPQTGIVRATWSGEIAARTLVVSSHGQPFRVDQSASQANTATTTPGTGQTAALFGPSFAWCIFGSAGPLGDTQATGHTIDDASTAVIAILGQRDGTTGGGAATNRTIQETYFQLTAADATQGALSGVTSRRWASAILTLRGTIETRASVGNHDLATIREIFDGKVTPIPHENMAIFYNEEEDRWEVWDAGSTVEGGTLITYYEVDGDGWIEV